MVAPMAATAAPALHLRRGLLAKILTASSMMATSSLSTSTSSSATPSAVGPLESLALSNSPDAPRAIRAHLSRGVAALSENIAVSASGSYVECSDGRKLLDMASGIGVLSTGHCHPRVSRAVADQASSLVHAQQNIFSSHVPMARLVDRLLKVTPKGLTTFLFANSGSEAVDTAVKLARAEGRGDELGLVDLVDVEVRAAGERRRGGRGVRGRGRIGRQRFRASGSKRGQLPPRE